MFISSSHKSPRLVICSQFFFVNRLVISLKLRSSKFGEGNVIKYLCDMTHNPCIRLWISISIPYSYLFLENPLAILKVLLWCCLKRGSKPNQKLSFKKIFKSFIEVSVESFQVQTIGKQAFAVFFYQ